MLEINSVILNVGLINFYLLLNTATPFTGSDVSYYG